jgi:hypothetical protein
VATALAHRLHQLGHLTDWHYSAIAIQPAHHGYRSGEPTGIDREVSDLLPSLFADARERHGVSLITIAEELALTAADARQLIFERGGLVPIRGEPDGTSPPMPPPLRIAR